MAMRWRTGPKSRTPCASSRACMPACRPTPPDGALQKGQERMPKQMIFAGLMLVAVAGGATPALCQTSSVWDGAYTSAQAERGAAKYRQMCVMCHGPALEGNGEAPPLTGRFIPDWAGTSLAELFEKIQVTMPLFAPATLNSSDTADILAFLLQSNKFP